MRDEPGLVQRIQQILYKAASMPLESPQVDLSKAMAQTPFGTSIAVLSAVSQLRMFMGWEL